MYGLTCVGLFHRSVSSANKSKGKSTIKGQFLSMEIAESTFITFCNCHDLGEYYHDKSEGSNIIWYNWFVLLIKLQFLLMHALHKDIVDLQMLLTHSLNLNFKNSQIKIFEFFLAFLTFLISLKLYQSVNPVLLLNLLFWIPSPMKRWIFLL